MLKKIISAIRDARNKNQIKPKDTVKLNIQTHDRKVYDNIMDILSRQVNAESIEYTLENISNAIVVAVEKDKFFLEADRQLDADVLKGELLKDLQHQKNFLESVLKKLSNERFVANAKAEVIDLEKKKQADAEARITVLEESLANL